MEYGLRRSVDMANNNGIVRINRRPAELSRPLLKFSGGPGDILRDVLR